MEHFLRASKIVTLIGSALLIGIAGLVIVILSPIVILAVMAGLGGYALYVYSVTSAKNKLSSLFDKKEEPMAAADAEVEEAREAAQTAEPEEMPGFKIISNPEELFEEIFKQDTAARLAQSQEAREAQPEPNFKDQVEADYKTQREFINISRDMENASNIDPAFRSRFYH